MHKSLSLQKGPPADGPTMRFGSKLGSTLTAGRVRSTTRAGEILLFVTLTSNMQVKCGFKNSKRKQSFFSGVHAKRAVSPSSPTHFRQTLRLNVKDLFLHCFGRQAQQPTHKLGNCARSRTSSMRNNMFVHLGSRRARERAWTMIIVSTQLDMTRGLPAGHYLCISAANSKLSKLCSSIHAITSLPLTTRKRLRKPLTNNGTKNLNSQKCVTITQTAK